MKFVLGMVPVLSNQKGPWTQWTGPLVDVGFTHNPCPNWIAMAGSIRLGWLGTSPEAMAQPIDLTAADQPVLRDPAR